MPPAPDRPAHSLGMDLGSTTAKIVLTDASGNILQQTYQRHKANVLATLLDMLAQLRLTVGDLAVVPVFTGSAGMGLAEKTKIAFVQEVVAEAEAARHHYADSRMLIDIGGEDCKMIFFRHRAHPDMRMNGNCAGGTGAFIDQMSSLINISLQELDSLAQQGSGKHRIASRCGVFAKTDIQNLINTGVSRNDIALAVFQAVACQAVTSLTRGHKIEGPVIFTGGPLHFFKTLRTALLKVLSLSEEDAVLPIESLVFPAYGAALSVSADADRIQPLKDIITTIEDKAGGINLSSHHQPLFADELEYRAWLNRKSVHAVPRVPLAKAAGTEVFLGIDAGSTTTKVVAIDAEDRILYQYYSGNLGDPLGAVRRGLEGLASHFKAHPSAFKIRCSGVTGYGEELIKSAFSIDLGSVETLAHYRAACKLESEVSFILDIGGQDMKAIFVRDQLVHNIEINESCSSGCGSFIETFADSLGFTAEQFGSLACTAKHPVDLGSRCTVFMNSSVKQALRQGNSPADVAAGLAYSVIQNCLHKVLRISDASVLGEKVVVQGGTFKNPAVLRAFEKLLGIEVIRPDIAEFMGAYGVALLAREKADGLPARLTSFSELLAMGEKIETSEHRCHGCTNGCGVRAIHFANSRKYFTGNRCERIFTNRDQEIEPGRNLIAEKIDLLLSFPENPPHHPWLTIGMPMVLNNFENYPFWSTLFSEIGWQVVRSSLSDPHLVTTSAVTVMSDNICFPAKLVHAHILDLLQDKVQRIFYPRVVYENSRFSSSANHYNCPIVTGYPDVIISSLDTDSQAIPIDSPTVNFNDRHMLKEACVAYFSRFGVDNAIFQQAFAKALQAQQSFVQAARRLGSSVLTEARLKNERIIVLGGRPYHGDPAINHGIPEMISTMGMHVLPEDSLPLEDVAFAEPLQVADQWEYSNRLYRAAYWVGREPLAQFVQFNSFGCGPDAVVIDELRAILRTYGKTPMVLKIDEITSIGSAKLRVRSLLESTTVRPDRHLRAVRPKVPLFQQKDRHRTLLVPDFSPFYSQFIQSMLTPMGYRVEILPPPDSESVRLGLKYTNNDICYPAIITIGDVLKALTSGRYDPDDIAVAFTETGGPCRATNYIALIKKALLAAGFDNIPVISASFQKLSSNFQPGFTLNRPKLTSLILSSLLVVDQLIRMYYATAVREKKTGDSLQVLQRNLAKARQHIGSWTMKNRHKILAAAIADFNGIPTRRGIYPKAGLVGEIYVKYNPFGNNNIVDKLMKNGIEVVIPPLFTFFIQTFINVEFNHFNNIERAGSLQRKKLSVIHALVNRKIKQANRMMTQFRHDLEPIILPEVLADKAKKVINLANQAGEGWLLPGEIVTMAESGIRNIISLQPFGCIANHVVAKGLGARISSLFPDLNLLNLDMDAGNSDVNMQNRLDFFIHSAKSGDAPEPAMSRT